MFNERDKSASKPDSTPSKRRNGHINRGGVTDEELKDIKIDATTLHVIRIFRAILQNPDGKVREMYDLAKLFESAIADPQRTVEYLPAARLSRKQQAITKASYEANSTFYGTKYEMAPEMIRRTRNNYLNMFLRELGVPNGSRTILVLGSGRGRDVDQLDREGFMVAAVDASPAMADAAEALLIGGETKVYNIDIIDAKESLFAISKGHFKGILAESVLEHLNKDDILDLIPYFRDMLHPGGVLQMRVKLTDSGLAYKVVDGIGERYFTSWTEDEIAALKTCLEQNNFELIEVDEPITTHVDAEIDKDREGVILKPPFYTIMARRKPRQ